MQCPKMKMVLRTENLVKEIRQAYGSKSCFFDVKQGEIVGLLGPNGAGKTTSFYMTTGLIVPNEGHIYLNDLDITSYPVYINGLKTVSAIWHKKRLYSAR